MLVEPLGFCDFKFQYPSSLELRRIYRVIENCVAKGITSLQLRRLARNLIKSELMNGSDGSVRDGLVSLGKPSALCASEMCSDIILTAGCVPLSDCNLNSEAMQEDHLRMHTDCTAECYFWRLYEVARCGWRLPNPEFKVKRVTRNHPPFIAFGNFSQESFDKQMSVAGAVEEVPVGDRLVLNPLLSVIKNCDLFRAHCVGVNVVDEASLREGMVRLDSAIKVRVCWDAGASGQNSGQPDFPFSYASIQDVSWLFYGKIRFGSHVLSLGFSSRVTLLLWLYESRPSLALQANAFWCQIGFRCFVSFHGRDFSDSPRRRCRISDRVYG